ncbi:TetR/AcrR family transcriptional regulator [Sulfurimonas sp.]|uniref:TetR/AcrR family transcriptional regulator n=1 Tax=Sulfurimonas sp. TaxID=2022749 RepID=UPI002B48BB29|nr:TetR/AcrR family transcriptional regulator [Sulfurimonas sp.]
MGSSREKLLDVAFDEFYYNGYYSTSIDKILKQANMNKGSIYHFFKSKKELGLAVIKERVHDYIENKYSVLLQYDTNIIEELLKLIKDRKNFDFVSGCKVNNLVQELSSKDKEFKSALETVYFRFEKIIEDVLSKAIQNKEIQHNNVKSLAIFVVASIEGCLITAKKSHDAGIFNNCISQLELFLNSLKFKK